MSAFPTLLRLPGEVLLPQEASKSPALGPVLEGVCVLSLLSRAHPWHATV